MLIAISGKIGSGKDTIGKIIKYLTSEKDNRLSFEEWDKLALNNSYWTVKKFADKLKDIVCLLIGCTREQLEDPIFKNTELGPEWDNWRYRLHFNGPNNPQLTPNGEFIYKNLLQETFEKMSKEEKEFHNAEFVKLTPRLLLQLLGTECGRNIIHPNIWVNALMSEYKSSLCNNGIFVTHTSPGGGTVSWIPCPIMYAESFPNWVITDLRFPNELEAVKKKQGITIRVNRKPFEWIDFDELHFERTGEKRTAAKVEEHESETALDSAEFDYVIYNTGTIEDLIEDVKGILIQENII